MSKLLTKNSPAIQPAETDGSFKTTLISSGVGHYGQRMNYEEALQLCGGFGRFQTFVTFVFAMGLFTGG